MNKVLGKTSLYVHSSRWAKCSVYHYRTASPLRRNFFSCDPQILSHIRTLKQGWVRVYQMPLKPQCFPSHRPLSWGEPIPGHPALLPWAPASFSRIDPTTEWEDSWHLSSQVQIQGPATTIIVPLAIWVRDASVLFLLALKKVQFLI